MWNHMDVLIALKDVTQKRNLPESDTHADSQFYKLCKLLHDEEKKNEQVYVCHFC